MSSRATHGGSTIVDMISVDLARRLSDAGLRWHPAPGDRFVVDTPGFEEDVFTLSDMTIEAHHHPTGTVLGFNGTTEWALDSVSAADSLWMPREDQLRTLLGPTFVSLSRDGDAFVVTSTDGTERDPDAEIAYARALLAYVRRSIDLDLPTLDTSALDD